MKEIKICSSQHSLGRQTRRQQRAALALFSEPYYQA